MRYVQFNDAKQSKIISEFLSPQDAETWPNQGEIEDDDPRYLAFINPPVLAQAAVKAQLAELDARAGRTVREALLALPVGTLPADTLQRLQTIEGEAEALRKILSAD